MHRELDSSGNPADLDAVLADYMRRIDAGQPVDRESLIAAHPQLARELREYFSHAGALDRFGSAATADFAAEQTPRGALEVRCPNCHQPTEVVADTTLTDLTCSACGSHFSLVDQSKDTRMAPSLTKLGRFELIERLGVGGFGTVWKARDKELDRTVAIKIPRAGDMSAEDQEKFFREARAAAQLRHPSIVSVHEVGRDGDSVYIVSDFVRGVTLGDWLTGQKLTSREAAELCAKIADALHHAHEKGVVHRDLKPANIMIDGDGQPHLMDFGLARREVGEVTVTMDGHVLGTPAYMSPEQAEGKAHTADRRSDVYSLGVIFFQLLTGELPFRGNARMLMHQVIHDEPPSPRKLNSSIPKDLETITLKCMEKDPELRYPNSKALSEELRRFLSGETIHARPVSRSERSIRWIRRNMIVSALLASVAIALVCGTLVSTYFAIVARRQSNIALAREDEAIVAKKHADAARQLAEQAKTEAEQHLYEQLIFRAGQELESNNVKEARRLLAIAPASLRGWEYGFLNRCIDRSIATFTPLPAAAGALSAAGVSQDSTILLLGLYSGRIYTVNTTSGNRTGSYLLDGQIEAIAIDPSKKLLAASHSTYSDPPQFTISIIKLADGQLAAQIKGQLEQVNSLAFSPDGKWLASGAGGSHGEHAVKIWNTNTWEVKHMLRGHGSPVTCVEFNQQSTWLLSGGGNRVILWDVFSGKEVRHFLMEGANATTVVFSKNASQVFAGGDDGTIQVWKSDGTDKAKLLRTHSDGLTSIVASGDDRLISSSRDRTIRVWNTQRGMQTQLLRGHDTGPLAAWAASQPESIMSVDRRGILKRWQFDTSPDVETLAGPEAGVTVMAPDINSTRLITGSDDEIVRVWDLTTGKGLAELVGHNRKGHRSDITGLAVVGAVPSIVSSSRDLTVRIWNGRTFNAVHVLRGHEREIEGLAATTDGTLAASTGSYDKQLILWDLQSGRERVRISADSWWAGAVSFSPDGRFTACGGSKGTVVVRETATQKIITTLGPLQNWIRSLAFSPDGKLLSASDGDFAVWSVPTSKKIWEGNFGAYVSKVAFSPDGSRLLTVDKDSVRLWDPRTGSQVWVRIIPGTKISDACFTPDGRRLLVGCKGKPSMLIFDAGSDWKKWLAEKRSRPADITDQRGDKTTNDVQRTLPQTATTHAPLEKPLRLGSDASLVVKVVRADGSPVIEAHCRLLVGGITRGGRGLPKRPSEDRELTSKTDEHGVVVFRHPDLTSLAHHALYVRKAGLSGESRFFDCSTVKTELSITMHEPIAVALRYVYQPQASLMLSGEGVVSGGLKLYPKENGSYRPPARAFFDLANNRRVGGGGLLEAKTPGIELDQKGAEVYFGGSRGRFDHATDIGRVNFDEVARVDHAKLIREREDTKMLLDHVYIYESNIYPPDKRTSFTGHEIRYAKILVESLIAKSIPSQIELSPSKPIANRPLVIRYRPGSADLDGAHEVSLWWAAYSDNGALLSPPPDKFDPPRFPTESGGTEGGDYRKGGTPCLNVPMAQLEEGFWSANIDLPSNSRSLALLMMDELGRTSDAGIVSYEVSEAVAPAKQVD